MNDKNGSPFSSDDNNFFEDFSSEEQGRNRQSFAGETPSLDIPDEVKNDSTHFFVDFSETPNPIPPTPQRPAPQSHAPIASHTFQEEPWQFNPLPEPQPQPSRQTFVQDPPPLPPTDYPDPVRVKPKKKKKRKALKVILISFAVIVAVLIGSVVFVFSGLTVRPLTDDPAALGIDPAIAEKYKNSGVTNIALFGVDTRDYESDKGRSDAIMILSIDRPHNIIKVTSLLRDSYVDIDGRGKDKLTHAYIYGGPELAIKTINQTFKLDIMSYATVNFAQLATVIDAVGGVEIEITELERQWINALANSEGLSAPDVTQSGLVRLTGAQATAFSRIRKIDSDVARANRQKKVIEAMLVSIKHSSIFQYPAMARKILSAMETSLDFSSVVKLSPAILFGGNTIAQINVPDTEDGAKGGNVGSQWVWQFDRDKAVTRLHKFIYEYDGRSE